LKDKGIIKEEDLGFPEKIDFSSLSEEE